MYKIINKETKEIIVTRGNYPISLVDDLLDKGNDIIIISTYSNTIKIPNGYEELNGIKEYLWKEYPLPQL